MFVLNEEICYYRESHNLLPIRFLKHEKRKRKCLPTISSVDLPEKVGLERWQYVYQVVFAYIQMMRDMSENDLRRLFDEEQNTRKGLWSCMQESSPTRTVTKIDIKLFCLALNSLLVFNMVVLPKPYQAASL